MATFNGLQRPDSIAVGLNISYTVPAGKVAKIKAVLDASASAQGTTGGSSGSSGSGTGGANSSVVEFILVGGDILSSSRTAASASGFTLPIASISTTTMIVNGSNSCTVTARAQHGAAFISGGSISIIGSANFGFIAEEYFG